MNILTISSCKIIGYTFFTLATLIEIILFCSIFSIDGNSIGKIIAIVATAGVFNAALWWFSQLYYKAKNTLETDTKE